MPGDIFLFLFLSIYNLDQHKRFLKKILQLDIFFVSALSGYFIMMYYTYAMQLDRENKAEHLKPTDNVVSEIALSYSKNIDKLKLTGKDVNEVVNINV